MKETTSGSPENPEPCYYGSTSWSVLGHRCHFSNGPVLRTAVILRTIMALVYALTASFWQMEAKYYAQNQTRRGSISTAASPRPPTRPSSGTFQMHDSLTLTAAALPSVSPKVPSIVGGQASPAFSQPAATPNASTKSHTDARM